MPLQTPDKPQQGPPVRTNPKADAKADKAYAKAMRPWYKKKRFILPAGFVLFLMAVSAGSSGGGSGSGDNGSSETGSSGSTSSGSASSGSNDNATSTAKPKAKAKAKAKPNGKSGTVGQALTNAGTTYKVTSARATKTIGDPDLFGARADGMFVVVTLQLTNNKDETKTFSDSSAKIKTSDGKEYETSDKAVLSFGDDSLLLKDIQPDLTARGKVAFELPPNKVSGSTLVIEDLFGSGEIKVDLGL
jgi:hypothetical protein